MARISAKTKEELVQAVGERYRSAEVLAKRRILDEFVQVTGFHRKHAIRVLNAEASTTARPAPRRSRLYEEGTRQAIVVLWEASDRVCGKRLKPLLPVLLPARERHGHLRLDDAVRSRVLAASASTLDRILAEPRASARGQQARVETIALDMLQPSLQTALRLSADAREEDVFDRFNVIGAQTTPRFA